MSKEIDEVHKAVAAMVKSIILSRQMLDITYCDKLLSCQRRFHSKLSDVKGDPAISHVNNTWHDYTSTIEDHASVHSGGIKALKGMFYFFSRQSNNLYSSILGCTDAIDAFTSPSDSWYKCPYQYIVRDGVNVACVEIDSAGTTPMAIGFQKDLQKADAIKTRWDVKSLGSCGPLF
jgi:hypothetical protein